jgi:hypothetical protein
VTCPRIFEWLPSPEVELSILAENSLFFEKTPFRPPKFCSIAQARAPPSNL